MAQVSYQFRHEIVERENVQLWYDWVPICALVSSDNMLEAKLQ